MKVLVCGGREYADRDAAYAVLDRVHAARGITMVIEGGCKGADRLAREWAQSRDVHYATVPALWNTRRNAAGPCRNEAMLCLAPAGVIAFPGGSGTADMTRRAALAGITVMQAYDPDTTPALDGEA